MNDTRDDDIEYLPNRTAFREYAIPERDDVDNLVDSLWRYGSAQDYPKPEALSPPAAHQPKRMCRREFTDQRSLIHDRNLDDPPVPGYKEFTSHVAATVNFDLPAKFTNREAAIYLAAFIDGEGHIGLHPTKAGYFTRHISFCNTDRQLLNKVVALCQQLGFKPALQTGAAPRNPEWAPRWTVYVARTRAAFEKFRKLIPIQAIAKRDTLDRILASYADPEATRLARQNGKTLPCEICRNPIYASAAVRRRGAGRFCSVKCRGIAQQQRVSRSCIECGTTFQVKPANPKKYCGNECYQQVSRERLQRQASYAARARWHADQQQESAIA